ncbi:uncharacterized protein [Rhodnius prolixus]|uniref:uncharacterized protein n=1 Tax=Rhodnius prolixus TaxID=13249 RepID=UPI003D188483
MKKGFSTVIIYKLHCFILMMPFNFAKLFKPKRIKVKLWFHGFTKDYYFLLTIKIKRDQIFFDLISDLRELLEEDVAVFYKGDMVKPSDTPTDLELKKGDIIDVYPISSLEAGSPPRT